MTVTVDRETLRKLVAGWRPNMTVEVKVSTLVGLLNLLDKTAAEVERLVTELEQLKAALQRRRETGSE